MSLGDKLDLAALIVAIISLILQATQPSSLTEQDAQRIVKQAIEQVQAEGVLPLPSPAPATGPTPTG